MEVRASDGRGSFIVISLDREVVVSLKLLTPLVTAAVGGGVQWLLNFQRNNKAVYFQKV
jgi:hypothetical protein